MSSIQALKAQREELVAHSFELELEIGFQPTFEQCLALRSVTSQLQAIDRKLEEAQMGDVAVRTPMYGSGSGDPNDSLTPGEAFVQSPAYHQWIQQHPSGGPSYGDSRSEVDNALHWLVELYLSGEEWWAWRQLVITTSEECGPAWPEGPATIEALYGMWRMTSDPLHAVDATIRLCRAPKSRIADDALAAHLMGHQREMARPTPDEALDVHTVAGRYKLGRTED